MFSDQAPHALNIVGPLLGAIDLYRGLYGYDILTAVATASVATFTAFHVHRTGKKDR